MTAAIISITPVWPERIIAALDASDATAKQLADGLNSDQLNWQPSPGAWSIGQCIEHLCITNELYLPAISGALANQPTSPVEEIQPVRFDKWFIKHFVEPSTQTKNVRAPKKIVPGSQVDLSVLDRFLRSNQSTRELILRARNYDVNRIRFKNPFIPLLRFTVGSGIEIMARHERRHLLQAERVKASPQFRK